MSVYAGTRLAAAKYANRRIVGNMSDHGGFTDRSTDFSGRTGRRSREDNAVTRAL